MPHEDDIKVASFTFEGGAGPAFREGVSIEVGGRGKVVQLWAAHYHITNFDTALVFAQWSTGISENPEHALDPPLSSSAMARSRAVYGRMTWNGGWAGNAGTWDVKPWVIPLYGIIRPRRQIWVNVGVMGEVNDFKPVLELYYTPIDTLPRQVLNSINRSRGKYRRS